MRRFGFPRRNILAGEDGRISVWILTPTGTTTPNSVHVWMDDKVWNDLYIWTEESMVYRFPLTHHGETFSGISYYWDDNILWNDSLMWTD